MIQTRKLRTLCVKKDLAQNTLKSMLAKSSPLTNLLSKFDNFKKAVFVSRLCVSSPPCCLALLKLLTQSHFPLEVLGLEKNDKMRHQSCCSLSSRKYREWFSRRVLSWVTEKQEAKPVKWGVTPRLLRRVTLRLVVHVTRPTTPAVIPATSLSFTFFHLKPPSSSNRHWPCALATSCCSSRWLLLSIFVEESRLFQAWLVESDYGHGPSCSTTYHTVYSTVFDTFFEKRCSKVTKTTVCNMHHNSQNLPEMLT